MEITRTESSVKRFKRSYRIRLKCTFCGRKLDRYIMPKSKKKTLAFCALCNPHQSSCKETNKTIGSEKSLAKTVFGGIGI